MTASLPDDTWLSSTGDSPSETLEETTYEYLTAEWRPVIKAISFTAWTIALSVLAVAPAVCVHLWRVLT
jgi:hypothetical protein